MSSHYRPRDMALIPSQMQITHYPASLSQSWSKLVSDVSWALRERDADEIPEAVLERYLLHFGLRLSASAYLTGNLVREAERYSINWTKMSWRQSNTLTLSRHLNSYSTTFGQINGASTAGVSDGFLYHVWQPYWGGKVTINYARISSRRMGRGRQSLSTAVLLDHRGDRISNCILSVAFDRRRGYMLVLEYTIDSRPGRVLVYRLGNPNIPTSSLKAEYDLPMPQPQHMSPVNLRMQAVNGTLVILCELLNRKDNSLVLMRYLNGTNDYLLHYTPTQAPISFYFVNETDILILERAPPPLRPGQTQLHLKLLRVHLKKSCTVRTLRVPPDLEAASSWATGTPVSSIRFVENVNVPVIHTSNRDMLHENGDYFGNWEGAPVGFKFGNGDEGDPAFNRVYVVKQAELMSSAPRPLVKAAAPGGQMHFMNGMKLVSVTLPDEGSGQVPMIRVEDYTDGIGNYVGLRDLPSTAETRHDMDGRWITTVLSQGRENVVSTTVVINKADHISVSEDAIVLWFRRRDYTKPNLRHDSLPEELTAEMYSF